MTVMLHLAFLALLAAAPPAPGAAPAPAEAGAAPAAPCANEGGLLAGSGLCRDAAFARLPKTRRNAWTPPEGCDVAVQEAPLSEGRWLLYAAQRCGERTARLDVAPGKMGALVLRYDETARNATLAGKPVITLVDSKSDTYAAVSALALAGLDVRQAKRCTLLAPEVEGYPIDAYVFDLPPREARKTAALDEPCGAYGRSARTDSYWRLFDGIGAFYVFGDDQPEFDPASLAVYKPSR
jgi:hypothetical protein